MIRNPASTPFFAATPKHKRVNTNGSDESNGSKMSFGMAFLRGRRRTLSSESAPARLQSKGAPTQDAGPFMQRLKRSFSNASTAPAALKRSLSFKNDSYERPTAPPPPSVPWNGTRYVTNLEQAAASSNLPNPPAPKPGVQIIAKPLDAFPQYARAWDMRQDGFDAYANALLERPRKSSNGSSRTPSLSRSVSPASSRSVSPALSSTSKRETIFIVADRALSPLLPPPPAFARQRAQTAPSLPRAPVAAPRSAEPPKPKSALKRSYSESDGRPPELREPRRVMFLLHEGPSSPFKPKASETKALSSLLIKGELLPLPGESHSETFEARTDQLMNALYLYAYDRGWKTPLDVADGLQAHLRRQPESLGFKDPTTYQSALVRALDEGLRWADASRSPRRYSAAIRDVFEDVCLDAALGGVESQVAIDL